MLSRILDREGFFLVKAPGRRLSRSAPPDHQPAGWAQGGREAEGRVPDRGVCSRGRVPPKPRSVDYWDDWYASKAATPTVGEIMNRHLGLPPDLLAGVVPAEAI